MICNLFRFTSYLELHTSCLDFSGLDMPSASATLDVWASGVSSDVWAAPSTCSKKS